jgi:hypothetical protein
MIRLFRVFVPSSVIALLLSEAILVFTCYVVATFIVLHEDPQVYLFDDNGLGSIAVVVACIIVGIYFHDLYGQFRIKSRILLFQQTAVVVGIAFLVQALLGYLKLRDFLLPTWLMIAGSSMVLILLPWWRIVYSSVVFKAMGSERVLFLGTSAVMQEIGEYLAEHPETGLVVLGYVDNVDSGVELAGGKMLGPISELREIVESVKPDRIVVGMSERRERLPVNQLLELRLSGIPIEDALTTYEATFGRISTRELRPSQLIFSSELGPNRGRVMLQSMYSLPIAIVAAAITAPVMLLVAAVVRVSSPGPALFRHNEWARTTRCSLFTSSAPCIATRKRPAARCGPRRMIHA